MAFGISREDLDAWKRTIERGEIAFLTHYWLDERFPDCRTVTKVGCSDINRLEAWGQTYGLKREWIHKRSGGYSHFDLLGKWEERILKEEGLIHTLDLFYKT